MINEGWKPLHASFEKRRKKKVLELTAATTFKVVKNLSLDIKSKSDVFIDVEISYINHC